MDKPKNLIKIRDIKNLLTQTSHIKNNCGS